MSITRLLKWRPTTDGGCPGRLPANSTVALPAISEIGWFSGSMVFNLDSAIANRFVADLWDLSNFSEDHSDPFVATKLRTGIHHKRKNSHRLQNSRRRVS